MQLNRYKITNYPVAAVWLINGLYCKVLSLVPRHQEIVARILGETHARPITLAIGLAEIGMAIWILSGIAKRFNAAAQIFIVALMNIIEFFLARDLLLWGGINALFALLFIAVVFANNFLFGEDKN